MRILISYAMIVKYGIKLFNAVAADGHTIFLDSGAYTNKRSGKEIVTLMDYAQFVDKNRDKLWKYINLDEIGNPQKTIDNYVQLVKWGFNPVPVLTQFSSDSEIANYSKLKSFFCIGGTVGMSTTKRDDIFQRYQRLGLEINKAHLLGVNNPGLIYKYKPYSYDSATYLHCFINGRRLVYDPINLNMRQTDDEIWDRLPHYAAYYPYSDVAIREQRKYISASEAIKMAAHTEMWGSKKFFVCCIIDDYKILMKGKEWYDKTIGKEVLYSGT